MDPPTFAACVIFSPSRATHALTEIDSPQRPAQMVQDTDSPRFFAELEAHKRILLKVARSYCREPADREDLIQDTVVALWRAFPAFQGRSQFSTWMYQIALNVAISYRRSETVRTRHVVSDEGELVRAATWTEADSPSVTLLYDFIETLNPFDKAIVLLYLDGYSQREMGQILGITPTNVGTKIARIKHTLQQRAAAEQGTAACGGSV
jgi:RNA polymerase sigma-70 factor, ECF subfamily